MSGGEPADGIGYAEAMAELEQILEHLEGDDLDVDVLAGRVERASVLIDVCRSRISQARVQVESVVAKLETPTADSDEHDTDDPRLLDEP